MCQLARAHASRGRGEQRTALRASAASAADVKSFDDIHGDVALAGTVSTGGCSTAIARSFSLAAHFRVASAT